MKIMLARCITAEDVDCRIEEEVQQFLQKHGFQVQSLQLPALEPDRPLCSIISYRLLPIEGMADALLCLDAHSAVLRHPRKLVWLLGGIDSIEAKPGGDFVSNILRAGVAEASILFGALDQAKQLRPNGMRTAKQPVVTLPSRWKPAKSRGKHADGWAPLLKALQP